MTAVLECSGSAAFERSAPRVALMSAVLAGFDVTGQVTALSMKTNGVFELGTQTGSVVARVARPGRAFEDVDKEIQVARWLTDRGFPTSRPLTAAPISCAMWLTTFWERLDGEETTLADAAPVGALLRRFHELVDDYPSAGGEWSLLSDLRRRLEDPAVTRLVHAAALVRLHETLVNLEAAALSGTFGLAPGIIHGDVHWGNVLRTRDGLCLIDFDRLTWGPREWEVLPMFFTRGRPSDVDPAAAQAFVDAFGWEPRGREDFNAFVSEVRELAMITTLLERPYSLEMHREIESRLARFTSRAEAPCWV